jgi:hypothetical protein
MASYDTPKTILLRGEAISTEAVAKSSEAIKPGMLLTRHTDGTFKKHATAGGNGAPLFAREADYVGGGIDDVYEDGENVVAWHCQRGAWVYALLKNGQNVAIGAFLESDGAGGMQDVGTSGNVLAQALEAVNNSSGGYARIKVEIL